MPIKERDILLLAASTLFTVVAWIGFNIYHVSVTSTIPKSLTEKIVSIDGKFDVTTVDGLKKREKIAPVSEASPVATQSGGSIASPSAQIKQATSSGATSGGIKL